MVDLQPSKRPAPNPMVRTWGENLKARRTLLGWNQDLLAERAGVPQATISKIENGRFTPSIDTLLDLAKGLGAHPAELYQWERAS